MSEVKAEEAAPLFAHEAAAHEISPMIVDLVPANQPCMLQLYRAESTLKPVFIERSHDITVGIHKFL